uniref:Uncharacterized protein n=1 Tax=Klebsiella pneumoniae TaxID=573 RepID=A0A6G6ANM1_KLEPN|nr:hypothetical protein [Klebsiella pneumoniae]UFD97023.1 hypothetical protein [Klebsiella pneumoniae]
MGSMSLKSYQKQTGPTLARTIKKTCIRSGCIDISNLSLTCKLRIFAFIDQLRRGDPTLRSKDNKRGYIIHLFCKIINQ